MPLRRGDLGLHLRDLRRGERLARPNAEALLSARVGGELAPVALVAQALTASAGVVPLRQVLLGLGDHLGGAAGEEEEREQEEEQEQGGVVSTGFCMNKNNGSTKIQGARGERAELPRAARAFTQGRLFLPR